MKPNCFVGEGTERPYHIYIVKGALDSHIHRPIQQYNI